MTDLFPEVVPDKAALLKRRMWARHQHSRVVDPSDNERYTLRPTIALCMRLARVSRIHLDTAACPEAHVADRWFGRQLDGSFIDGLATSWTPAGVRPEEAVDWNNPPYDALEEWVQRCLSAAVDGECGTVLMLPPGDRCDQPWWQQWIEPYRDGRGLFEGVAIETFHLPGRQKFGSPGDPSGHCATQAPFPSMLIVLRHVS